MFKFKATDRAEAPYSFWHFTSDGCTHQMVLGKGLTFDPHAFYKWMARISRRRNPNTLWIKVEVNQQRITIWER